MSLIYALERLFSENGSVDFTRIWKGYKIQIVHTPCIEETRHNIFKIFYLNTTHYAFNIFFGPNSTPNFSNLHKHRRMAGIAHIYSACT